MPTAETGVTPAVAAPEAEEHTASQVVPSDDGEPEEPQHEESVPYARFKKANEDLNLTKAQYEALQAKYSDMESFADFIEELRAEGLTNSNDVRAFISKQNVGSLAQQREGAEKSAAAEYHKAIAEGVDQDTAYRAYQLDMREAKIKYEDAVLKQREAEIRRTSTGSVASKIKAATEKYPEADADILRRLASLPGTDIEAEAKALHDKEIARQVKYAKAKGAQTETKGAGTKAGTQAAPAAGSACPDPLKFPKEAAEWLKKANARLSAAA